jgi:hypothetical protein
MKIRKILNEMSVPTVLYHGTDSKFTSFNDSKPIFFTDNIQVAKSYGSNVIKARLTLDNPIEVDFGGNSTSYFRGKNYVPSDMAKTIKELSDDLKQYGRLEDDEMYELEQEYDWSDSYGDLDGIIMKNIKDSYGDMFAGDIVANNYVVFDKNQIKLIK